MKVDLEKIIIGVSPVTKKAYAGILNKDKTMWLYKNDVDDSFAASVIDKWLGKKETITYEIGKTFEISVKEIKSKHTR